VADTKISSLVAKTTLGDSDLLALVDIAATPDETKKITVANAKTQLVNSTTVNSAGAVMNTDGLSVSNDGTKTTVVGQTGDYNRIGEGGTTAHSLASENDWMVTGKLEVKGVTYLDGNVTVGGTVDGRDLDTDGTKLDAVEASADVTDATNVNGAGATMNADSTLAGNSYFLDEDNMVSDDATKVASQQSVKKYVDDSIDTDVATHAAIKSANATLGHVIVETASKVDVDANGKLTLGSDVLLEADLEGTPTEDLATKAPTSEWAFDHNAAVLSSSVHDNDNWFSGYGAEQIAGLRAYLKVPALTAISDPSSILNVTDWYGVSGTYIQADADSDATHIEDDDANFPDSIKYTLVKWASNAAGDADTGIGVITVVDSDTLTIGKCSGANFGASYYYWIKHSELVIPVTGLYLITGAVLFLPAEADKVFHVRIWGFTGTNAPTSLVSSSISSPIADQCAPSGSWLVPLTASQSIYLQSYHGGTEGTPTLYYAAASHNPLSIFLMKQTA